MALAGLMGCAHQPAAAPPPPQSPAPTSAAPAPVATPEQAPQPAPVAPSPVAPAPPTQMPAPAANPAAQPARPATGAPAHANAPKRAAPAAAPGAVAGSPPAAAAAPVATSAPATLDLNSLEQRLRDTHAIGVFTKLSLKNQVDDLLGQFRGFYGGHPVPTLVDLRRSYELLLLKVVTLLQDADPALASAVSSSREAIWAILSDRTRFNTL